MSERLAELKAQVGGHKILKVYRDNYVCKPLDRRECSFYHSYPASLEPLLPKFGGVLSVGSSGTQDDFILLENLCTGYRKPCVLDLKMGTRMYGDFATEKKRRSQDMKTRETTSGKLGVRLCGYQRYSKSTRSFQKVDKYVGRKVDVPKFQEMLQAFFTVGGTLQRSVIINIIHQVERMRDVILSLGSFRFYSSSILIVFEGDQPDFPDELHHAQAHAQLDQSSSTLPCDPFNRHLHHYNHNHLRRPNHRRSQSTAEEDDDEDDTTVSHDDGTGNNDENDQ